MLTKQPLSGRDIVWSSEFGVRVGVNGYGWLWGERIGDDVDLLGLLKSCYGRYCTRFFPIVARPKSHAKTTKSYVVRTSYDK